ncbi:MAG TPA: right-handed parallel beta-helix repeat-containing protein [Candidatus Methanoperedens sp.]|nr:right-handed parallel beta-helix repeat-containing protein [Candidatus Methanoperedens sp.]
MENAFSRCARALALLVLVASPAHAAAISLQAGTWTIWQGTVDVAEEVRVDAGATLVVQPGTTVRFATEKLPDGTPKARLLVHGTLVAQGTADEPIVFTSAAPEPRPGDWGGIVLEKTGESRNRLTHARIEYGAPGLTGMGARLIAEDIVIRRNLTGVYALQNFTGWIFRGSIVDNRVGVSYVQCSSFHLEDCEISGNEAGGVACLQGSSPTVRFSNIANNGPRGITCQQGSSPLIQGNAIRGNKQGIFLELQSRPQLDRNLITGNETGIWGEKLVFPTVEGNEIAGNGTGIYCNYSAYMVIHGNNIRDNRGFALVLGDNMSILMEQQIPFRHLGKFYFSKPPAEVTAEALPEQTHKFQPYPENAGVVDARGNWWGRDANEEMAKLGEDGNAALIEDVHDKPDTFYEGQSYRRDRAAFAPVAPEPIAAAGPPAKSNCGVAGKVVLAGAPLPGVRVHAYADAKNAFKGEAEVYSAPTAKDGSFVLHLPPGVYFLVAKGPSPPLPAEEPREGGFFGYYGGNPVTVSAGVYASANIQAVRRKAVVVAAVPGETAGIEGIVLGPAGPVAGASVHLYADASRQFRGPDLFGPQGGVPGGTDEKGAFAIQAPPGRYFLVASKRMAGDVLGPLRPGDLYGWFDGNPLAPAAGTKAAIVIQAVEKLREAALAPPAAGVTGIRGKVLDPSGKAPAGVYAFATTDPSFMIGAMPPYRSQPLGPDGSYLIELPQGGTYYVSARSGYGGPPLPGEWHGFHGEKTPRAVVVEAGSVAEGIDFVVKRME